MNCMARTMLFLALSLFLATPVPSAQSANKSSATSQDTLNQYVEKLKKNPADAALREKIIKQALTIKPATTVPENVERNMARGAAFAQKGAGAGGYTKAIVEFEAAANNAPWLAIAYFNLGVVQEKAGYYREAIKNYNWYLMAAPDAINARDVKNTVYALETEVDAGKYAVTSASPTAGPAPAGGPVASKKMTLSIEPVKQHTIVPLPPAKQKPNTPSIIGNWFFKDIVRGEERIVQAFQISKNANGDIIAIPPRRGDDYIPAIRDLAVSDTRMKIAIHWRMTSVVGYWKIETYDLALSEDGEKLLGSYVEKSVGGRNITLDRTLFRQ